MGNKNQLVWLREGYTSVAMLVSLCRVAAMIALLVPLASCRSLPKLVVGVWYGRMDVMNDATQVALDIKQISNAANAKSSVIMLSQVNHTLKITVDGRKRPWHMDIKYLGEGMHELPAQLCLTEVLQREEYPDVLRVQFPETHPEHGWTETRPSNFGQNAMILRRAGIDDESPKGYLKPGRKVTWDEWQGKEDWIPEPHDWRHKPSDTRHRDIEL